MKIVMTENEIKGLSYELKQIYYAIVIEQEFEFPNNVYVDIISEVVEENNKLLQEFTIAHNDSSYSINFDEELVQNFFNRIDNLLQDIGKVVYKFNEKFQNTSDIMAIIVPYIVGKICVSNDEILLFIGLAIGISKIAIGTFTNKYEKYIDEKTINDDLKDICIMNLEVLKKAEKTEEIQKYTEDLNKILEKLNNE